MAHNELPHSDLICAFSSGSKLLANSTVFIFGTLKLNSDCNMTLTFSPLSIIGNGAV